MIKIIRTPAPSFYFAAPTTGNAVSLSNQSKPLTINQRMLSAAAIFVCACLVLSCNNNAEQSPAPATTASTTTQPAGQSGAKDSESQKNVGSPDGHAGTY
jgi:hypothetical protein